MLHPTHFVWWAGQPVVFHPSKTDVNRGFVYLSGRRKYGTINFSTSIGWQFRTHEVTAAQSGYSDSPALTSV